MHSTSKTFLQSTKGTNMSIVEIDFTLTIQITLTWDLQMNKKRIERKQRSTLCTRTCFFSQHTKPFCAFRLKKILQAWHAVAPKYLYNAGAPQILHSVRWIFIFDESPVSSSIGSLSRWKQIDQGIFFSQGQSNNSRMQSFYLMEFCSISIVFIVSPCADRAKNISRSFSPFDDDDEGEILAAIHSSSFLQIDYIKIVPLTSMYFREKHINKCELEGQIISNVSSYYIFKSNERERKTRLLVNTSTITQIIKYLY